MAIYEGSEVYSFKINEDRGYREIKLTVKELEALVEDLIGTLYESSSDSETLYEFSKELNDSLARRYLFMGKG
jgi:hypothetical protein